MAIESMQSLLFTDVDRIIRLQDKYIDNYSTKAIDIHSHKEYNKGIVNENQYQKENLFDKFFLHVICKGCESMALAMLKIGEAATIQEFRTKENLKKHLQNLGFIPGEKVEVVGENNSGMILLVKGVRVALNRGLASKILVEMAA